MGEVTIGTATYQGFATVETADEYLAADIIRATPWALLNDDAKGRALISATRMMLILPWCEEAPDPAVDQESPIPEVAAMLAADLAANPSLFMDATGNSNIKRAKAGSAEVEFFTPVEGGPPLPRNLWDRLLAANLVCAGAGDTNALLDGAQPFGTSDGACHGRPLYGYPVMDWYAVLTGGFE